MGRPPSSNSKRNKQRRAEYEKERLLDKLAAFQEFEAEFLPQLKELLKSGADSAKMRDEMAPILTAKLLSMAIVEKDTSKALAVIKDQLDRTEGKAKERIETEHKFSKLKDEELDALLESRLKEAGDIDDDSDSDTLQ
jgi:hypothetical protein